MADPEQLSTQVEVFPEESRVEVRIPIMASGLEPPLVILVPTTGEGKPRVTTSVAGATPEVPELVATLDTVAPGQYIVRIDVDQYLSKELPLAVVEGHENPLHVTLRTRPAERVIHNAAK